MKFFHRKSTLKFDWETVSSAWHRRYPNPFSKHVLSEDVISRFHDNVKNAQNHRILFISDVRILFISDGPYGVEALHLKKVDLMLVEIQHGENDVLKSKRLLVKTNPAPKWTTRIIGTGIKSACIIEESVVDPNKKTMTTYSRNIFFTSLMVVEEKCVYSVCPNNKSWTECRKEAWISSNVFGLARTIESFGIERYKRNIDRARKGLEYITERLFIPDRLPYKMQSQAIGSTP